MSFSKQYLIAGICKYVTLIAVPFTISYIYFKVYTVEEGISYTLLALILVGVVFAVKFGKKTLDEEFPDRFKWIGKLIGNLVLTALIVALLIAVRAYINTVIWLAVFIAIGEVCSVPFVIWQNIAKQKDFTDNFGTKPLADAINNYTGGEH